VFRRCIPFADSHSATEQLPRRDLQNILLFRISGSEKGLGTMAPPVKSSLLSQ